MDKRRRYKPDEFLNKKFDKLLVIKIIYNEKSGFTCQCLCDCGNLTQSKPGLLYHHVRKSCGCLWKISAAKGLKVKLNNIKPLIGEIYSNQWSTIKNDARKRNIEFNIDVNYAWNLYLQQNRKCAISGIDIVFPKIGYAIDPANRTASLDRIDSNKPYIEGNVQWVHKDVNIMKNIFPQDYFIQICELITRNQNERKSSS